MTISIYRSCRFFISINYIKIKNETVTRKSYVAGAADHLLITGERLAIMAKTIELNYSLEPDRFFINRWNQQMFFWKSRKRGMRKGFFVLPDKTIGAFGLLHFVGQSYFEA